jgi:hypothetical protein
MTIDKKVLFGLLGLLVLLALFISWEQYNQSGKLDQLNSGVAQLNAPAVTVVKCANGLAPTAPGVCADGSTPQ